MQGVGGAIASAVSLGLVMYLFTENADRAKAMGIFGFVASGGGAIGVLLGGDPHRRARLALDLPRQHPDRHRRRRALAAAAAHARSGHDAEGKLDVAGAITVTAALMLAVYAIVNGNQEGWTSLNTLGLLAIAAALLGVFVLIESRVELAARAARASSSCATSRPRTSSACSGPRRCSRGSSWRRSTCSSCWATARCRSASSFLPANILMGILSVAVSARLVMRFGIKPPLVVGLLVAAAGLALFARAPVDGSYLTDVLPSMLLLGFGAGIAFNPVLLAAMSDVAPEESGLASGFVNTAFMMGGALGLAVLASLAASRTDTLTRRWRQPPHRARRRLPRGLRRRRAVRRLGRHDRRAAPAHRASRPWRTKPSRRRPTRTPAEVS